MSLKSTQPRRFEPGGQSAVPPRSAHASGPAGAAATRDRFLNLVAYDGNLEMASQIRRQITPEYVRGLIGAPLSWEHAGGDIFDWLTECKTTGQMRERVEKHDSTFGTVVDAFVLGNRLYASVKLKDGVRVPKPIADWMETSLSDICWPTSNGHRTPEVIELSGTGKAARPGCRVLDQIDPRAFKQKMADRESVLAKMNDQQRVAMQKVMDLFDSHPDVLNFSKLVPPELRDIIGSEFASLITSLEKSRSLEKSEPPAPAAAPAAAPAPMDTRTQQLEAFARKTAAESLRQYGVPEEMSTAYAAANDPITINEHVMPLLRACSAAAMQKAGIRAEQLSDAPEGPPAKMQRTETQDWHSLSEQNLAKIKKFRGSLRDP